MVIATAFTSGWEKDSVVVVAEIETAGRTILADALDRRGTYRVSPEDFLAISAMRQVNDGELPGMMTLDRARCRVILEALRGHPRVTLGRGKPVEVAELLAMAGGEGEGTKGSEGITGRNGVELEPGRPGFILQIEGSLNHLAARLHARYGDRVLRAGELRASGDSVRYRDETGRWRGRNIEAELAALDRLRAGGFSEPDGKGEMALKGERAILRFLGEALPALEREWKVELGARFSNINETIARVRPAGGRAGVRRELV